MIKVWKMASAVREVTIKEGDKKYKALKEAYDITGNENSIAQLEHWIEKQ